MSVTEEHRKLALEIYAAVSREQSGAATNMEPDEGATLLADFERNLLQTLNADAEADILKGNPITGAHHRAIERRLTALSVPERENRGGG